jgi:Xaa-Pro aminopeptidase
VAGGDGVEVELVSPIPDGQVQPAGTHLDGVHAAVLDSEQAAREAKGFEIVLRDKKGVAELTADLCAKTGARRVGFESQIVTHAFHKSLDKALGPDRLVATSDLVEGLRLIKDAEEIKAIKKSSN